jgi:hypothetical protein
VNKQRYKRYFYQTKQTINNRINFIKSTANDIPASQIYRILRGQHSGVLLPEHFTINNNIFTLGLVFPMIAITIIIHYL